MKTLYIARHAKSSWNYPDLKDHDRPLLEKGKKRTRKVINFLKNEQVQPEIILSSTARRAAETATYFASGCGVGPENLVFEAALYHAGREELFRYLAHVSNQIQSLMIVGHNPAMTNFANHFLRDPIDWLPTSAVVGLQIDTPDWSGIASAACELRFIAIPKSMQDT